MATLPLKYVQKCYEALKYVDDYEVKSSHVYVDTGITEISDEPYVDIYHYGTLIFRIYYGCSEVCLFGGYSKSDKDIINSFLIMYGLDDMYWVIKSKDKLEVVQTI